MSDTDSFIEEVTEEVRRDRLFGLLRRYGLIAATVIVVLVGGAAYNEWQKAQTRAEAQAFGDAILAALEQDAADARRTALGAIAADTPRQQALIAMFLAQEAEAGQAGDVTQALETLAQTDTLPQVYRELALLKFVMRADSGLTPEDKIARLTPLTIPGAPYRLLALEQTALAEVAMGDTDAALTRLQGILSEDQVSQGLRRRVSQLIIALGGTLDAA